MKLKSTGEKFIFAWERIYKEILTIKPDLHATTVSSSMYNIVIIAPNVIKTDWGELKFMSIFTLKSSQSTQ